MARFFLNIRREGVLIPDPNGDELPDAEAACDLALATMRDIRSLPHIYGKDWLKNELVVTDEEGRHVLTLSFKALH